MIAEPVGIAAKAKIHEPANVRHLPHSYCCPPSVTFFGETI